MNVLITGGTGSLGKALTSHLLADHNISRIVIYSRDEWKQAEMAKSVLVNRDRVRYFIGDVRDVERLKQAMCGVDVVIHTAALKRVDSVSYNPGEVVKTNVLGTMNVIEAAVHNGVQKVMLISSDKAVEPMNIYGASKMLAEQYAVYSNCFSYPQGTAVSAVRYGNVLGSRGSVVPFWKSQLANGIPISITDGGHTRFWLTMTQAVNFVMDSINVMRGGEIFVPKLRGSPITQLAEAMGADAGGFVAPRPGGEKLHEKLLSTEELFRTHDAGFAYLIAPSLSPWGLKVDLPQRGGMLEYSSNQVEQFTVEELRGMLLSEGLI